MIQFLILLVMACQATAKAVFAHFMVDNTRYFTVETWKVEMQKAQESKIDAFALNINHNAEDLSAHLSLAFEAANAVDFKLFFSFDYAGLGPWPKEAVITRLKEYGLDDAYFKRPDGKPLASTFEGSDNASDWPEIKTQTNCFFIPDWSSRGAMVAMSLPGPDGLFNWGAWPEAPKNMSMVTDTSYTHFLNGKPYMMAVSPWFYTNLPGYRKNWLWPSDTLWWKRWQQVWKIQPEYVQIISWNDYGESHYIGGLYEEELGALQPEAGNPPFDYVSGISHEGWRELLPYAIETYKSNRSHIEDERLVVWYRPNPSAECSDGGTTANDAGHGQQTLNPADVQSDAIYWSVLATSRPEVWVMVGDTSVKSIIIGEPVRGTGVWHGQALYGSARGEVTVKAHRSNATIPGLEVKGDKPISTSCQFVNWNAVVASARSTAGAFISPPYGSNSSNV